MNTFGKWSIEEKGSEWTEGRRGEQKKGGDEGKRGKIDRRNGDAR